MERLSDRAIEIINELHTERLDYNSEYLPLIDAAQKLNDIETVMGDYDLDRLRELVQADREGRYIIMRDAERNGVARLKELSEADREGRCVVLPCKSGDVVWIVERTENGEPDGVRAYVFLAKVTDYVIVDEFLNGCNELEDIMKYEVAETISDFSSYLPVFPACDCYLDKESALKAMKESENDG